MELRSSRSRSKTPLHVAPQITFDTQQIEEESHHAETIGVRKTRKTTTIKVTQSATSSTSESYNNTRLNKIKLKPKQQSDKSVRSLYKTSDYSSEEGDNEVSSTRTINQNERNQLIEDARKAANGTAQVSALGLYIKSGHYWDVYPKTDWTYSQHSRDRVEIAPGVVAMPNMSRRSIHTMCDTSGTSSSYIESNMQHKTTNTDGSYLKYSRYSDTVDIKPRQLSFNNNYDDHTEFSTKVSSYTSRSLRSQWITVRRKFVQIYTSIIAVLYYLYNVQTYWFAKLHRLSSWVMLLDTWLLRKNGSRDKLAAVMALCLLPLLFLGGYWFLSSLGSFLYGTFFNTTSVPTIYPNLVIENIQPEISNNKLSQNQLDAITASLQSSINLHDDHQKQVIDDLRNEINKIRQEVYKYQSEAAFRTSRLSYQITKCCQKPIINIEGYIKKILNDQDFLKDQDGFNRYLHSLFVAKHDLEVVLANLTQNIQFDLSRLVKENSKVIMDEIVMKVASGDSLTDDHVRGIVLNVLKLYDADRTGLVDYALESMGGQILTTRCTENYHYGKAVVSVLGIPLWYPVNSPRTIITPDLSPGKCWAFQNFPGFVVVKLSNKVKVEAFSMEHVSKLLVPNGRIDSAPKEFEVYGLQSVNDNSPVLLGRYVYDYDGEPLQFFGVENGEGIYEVIELRILSNHGNPNYTCLYRFRVHGQT